MKMIGSRLARRASAVAKSAYRGLNIAKRDVRVSYLGQLVPAKPTTLNLLVNDICNSRCQMCSVWKQKRKREFTPSELELILRDQLFSDLRYVGVSGGEPTLRTDLPEIYRVLVRKQPPIVGTGIITNAVRKHDVIASILASAGVCAQAGVSFNVMVSLDGIGATHDRVRGREGNFESAVAVIRHLRDETEIPVSIGCTITKDNVWAVDEVLDFCRSEGVYGRFRVAEFIRRLYNEEQVEYIRNFTERERYHLGLFFAKLEYTYEKSGRIRRTYRSIRRMLMDGAERSIRCPWQTTAVTLDSRGQLLYCAPKSPVLGSCLEESAQTLYLTNIRRRKAIIANDCSNCIHDYHAERTMSELCSELKARRWRRRLSLDRALDEVRTRLPFRSVFGRDHAPREFLLTGWYGTETAGDKATLGDIISHIRNEYQGAHIVLASLYPYVSQWTVRELGHPDVEVIPVYSGPFWHRTGIADEVIVAGGPLMHLEVLGVLLWAFLRAKRAGHRTRIAGCGIGPLDRGSRYEDAVRNILLLADSIELRDAASVAWARRITGRADIANSGDPAAGFVHTWMKQHPASQATACLNMYLRDWTTEYQGDLTDGEFEETKSRFEQQLGLWVHEICAQLGLRPRLVPMHHFCIGNDDRDFNRRFARVHLSDLDPVVERLPLSVQEILGAMQEAALCLCMRFHSVLFANTLGVPFLAIDYTQGGKIANYLADHDRLDRMICLKDVAAGRWYDFQAKLANTCFRID